MTQNNLKDLFESQVKRTPGKTAVVDSNGSLTYDELDRQANRIAHALIGYGAEAGTFVGVITEHSADMIAALLAVIKSGAAYIVIEPDFPCERIHYILSEASVGLAVTEKKYAGIFPERTKLILTGDSGPDRVGKTGLATHPDTAPEVSVSGSDAIYVLYTSGSTGTPKGVVVEHHNVANYVEAFRMEFGLNENDRVLQCSVCTFDIFTEEVFPALLSGGTLVVATRNEASDPERLVELMERERVTVISGFPYLLQDVDPMETPSALRLAIAGGDVLRKEYVPNLVGKIKVYNTYGPSETTVCATYYHYTGVTTDTGSIPVGKPVHGTQVYILNESLKEVPRGETGEICIAGRGVSRGYLGRDEETAKAFVPDPFGSGGRMYLSGDLGRVLPDGNIDFIKREDEQVMIGGKRVEPMEVENLLSRFENIDFVVVKPFIEKAGGNYLAAYYTAPRELDRNELKSYLSKYVPEYMVPEYFVWLTDIPKTPNGKVDRAALPAMERV